MTVDKTVAEWALEMDNGTTLEASVHETQPGGKRHLKLGPRHRWSKGKRKKRGTKRFTPSEALALYHFIRDHAAEPLGIDPERFDPPNPETHED